LPHRQTFTRKIIPATDKRLDEENMARLKSKMQKVGGTIMSDGWQSTTSRPIINVILGVDGMLSLRLATDCSGKDKTMEFICDLVSKVIEDLGHLKAAVEAKDKQIVDLIKASALLEKEVNEGKAAKAGSLQLSSTIEIKNQEINKLRSELNASVEIKNQEINKLRGEIELVKKNVPDSKTIEVLTNNVKLLEERNKALVDFLSPYVANIRSFFKSIQGSLEMGIEMEAILYEKLNKK
jgi:hypothetical protein